MCERHHWEKKGGPSNYLMSRCGRSGAPIPSSSAARRKVRGVLEGDKKSADMPLLTVSRIPFTSRRSISDKSQLIGDRPEMY